MSGLRELRRSHGRNFDRQASSLRRRLDRMPPADAAPTIKDIREIARPLSPPPPPPAEDDDGDDHVPSANLSDVRNASSADNTYTVPPILITVVNL